MAEGSERRSSGNHLQEKQRRRTGAEEGQAYQEEGRKERRRNLHPRHLHHWVVPVSQPPPSQRTGRPPAYHRTSEG